MATRIFRVGLGALALLLLAGANGRAQDTPGTSPEAQKPLKARILYTGRLLGYFRLPNQQTKTNLKCPPVPDPAADPDAKKFLDILEEARRAPGDTLLVGMGDNFAPQLEARVFSEPPTSIPGSATHFYPRGKDYYNWNPGFPSPTGNVGWLSVIDQQPEGLTAMLKAGVGYIPLDNVGCFLLAAHYDAVVPGKHDFYFGPEHLRYLARFLADGKKHGFEPVQMLATNLVIRTDFAGAHTSLPDSDRRRPFDTEDANLTPQNLSQGKAALPWLRYIRFKFSGDERKKDRTARLCRTDSGNADHYPDPASVDPKDDSCRSVKVRWTQEVGGELITLRDDEPLRPVPPGTKPKLFLDFPLEIPHRDRTRTYMACLSPHELPHPSRSSPHPYYCLRFTLDVPFFLFPEADPELNVTPTGYSNPKPFVLKQLTNGTEVAIFGVVDPKLREYVGELNFAWSNDDKRFKTEIAVTDPVGALNQLMQYFDDWYEKKQCGQLTGPERTSCAKGRGIFRGIKVLLAQMSAPQAGHLAVQLKGKFHVVLSEAETDYATPEETVVYGAEASSDASAPPAAAPPPRPFVVAPAPAYDYNAKLKQRELHIRAVKVEHGADKRWGFDVIGKPTCMGPAAPRLNANAIFINAVREALQRLARSQGELQAEIQMLTPEQAMQQLTLHTLKQATRADVALVQKRDFFWPFVKPEEVTTAKLPELLDRVIWKGDIIYRVAVKGSTLKDVVKQSAQFDQEDTATISLEDERNRGLAQLGVFFDAQRKEYLINGEALDPNRVYTVAATDYAGLGDTGYPGLGQPAVGRVPLPRDFHRPIVTVSGQVCENMKHVSGFGDAPCPAPVEAAKYFDELHDSPADATKGDTNLHQLGVWSFIFHPTRRPRTGLSTMSRVERNAQEGRVQFFSLEKASLGFTTVRNNVTEAERGAEFGGVSVSQLGAAKSHSFDITLNSRYGALGRRWDWFVRQELRFVSDVTGQANKAPILNLKNNLFATEPGVFWHPSKGKDWPRWGLLISLREETQLAQPQEKFTLSDAAQSKIVFRRDRTNTVFPHLGFRIQNRNSYFEAGYELGADTRVTGFVFSTDTGPVPCPVAAESAQGVQECIKEHSRVSPPPLTPILTASSRPTTLFATVFRDGAFSNLKLVVPLHPKVSYVLQNQFDFFRKHRQNDLSTDTRFRDLWSNAFSFKVIGNLAVEPKFEVFFYENKVDGNFFRQVQSTITISYSFDWFSGGRLWGEAMHYSKPKQ